MEQLHECSSAILLLFQSAKPANFGNSAHVTLVRLAERTGCAMTATRWRKLVSGDIESLISAASLSDWSPRADYTRAITQATLSTQPRSCTAVGGSS